MVLHNVFAVYLMLLLRLSLVVQKMSKSDSLKASELIYSPFLKIYAPLLLFIHN